MSLSATAAVAAVVTLALVILAVSAYRLWLRLTGDDHCRRCGHLVDVHCHLRRGTDCGMSGCGCERLA